MFLPYYLYHSYARWGSPVVQIGIFGIGDMLSELRDCDFRLRLAGNMLYLSVERLAGFASPCVRVRVRILVLYYVTRSCPRYLLSLRAGAPFRVCFAVNSIHRIFAQFKSDPMLCVAHGESGNPIFDYLLRL